MKVLKFGGTSVGSPERMRDVARLVTADNEKKIVVLSAMSGTTNALIGISSLLYKGDSKAALKALDDLNAVYSGHVDSLYHSDSSKEKVNAYIAEQFDFLRAFTKDVFTPHEEKVVVSFGELLSTFMFVTLLEELGHAPVMLRALDFMRTDTQGEPDLDYISGKLSRLLDAAKETSLFVTQGFICRNAYGEVDNLKRGGSDYTASLIGAACGASEIQIWTDIDGMHDNDPRFVEDTTPVRHLNFDEAAELAYFGAKILHPTCVQPAKHANIPVRLLNTMQPQAEGTIISNDSELRKIKAVAAKDNITAIKIKSSRMLLAHGFLRKVFEIFESYRTPIDMICTSEVGVSLTIDDTSSLDEIVADLRRYGTVTVDSGMCIVCVVGDLDWRNVGFEADAMDAMRDIPTRMISFGGSNYNISFLIREEDKQKALRALSEHLFNHPAKI